MILDVLYLSFPQSDKNPNKEISVKFRRQIASNYARYYTRSMCKGLQGQITMYNNIQSFPFNNWNI